MTKEEKEIVNMWIESIEDTIENHKEAEKRSMDYFKYMDKNDICCPLCKTTRILIEDLKYYEVFKARLFKAGCELCPWTVYKEGMCYEFIEESGELEVSNYDKSIARLESWLDNFKNKPEEYLIKTNKWRRK